MIETLNWGSHLPALMACTAVCGGPVLEIGCGHFSTPCLHALCSALGHQLVTLETEDVWRNQFADYATSSHRVLKQTNELVHELSKQKWGVVLIDDSPDNRIGWLDVFFNSTKYMLFHDCNFPQYAVPTSEWLKVNQCNSRIYTRYGPYTLVVSKEHQIPELQP
jgi:hypothetical protein